MAQSQQEPGLATPTIDLQSILIPLRRTEQLATQEELEADNIYDFSTLFASLVQALDIHVSNRELCAVLPFFEKDASSKSLGLQDTLNAMASLGKIPHRVSVDLKLLDSRLTPCLFVPESWRISRPLSREKIDKNPRRSPFVIVSMVEDDDDIELDTPPKTSRNKKTILNVLYQNSSEVEQLEIDGSIKGNAWIFVDEEEDSNLSPLSKTMMDASGYSWFRALLSKFSNSASAILMIGGMLTILALVAPLFVMLVYDKVIGSHAPETLMPLLIGAILALSVEAGLRMMRAQALSWYGARLDYIVSTSIYERLVNLPVLFTERASVAAQISRVKAFDAVRAFFTGPQFLALAELPFTILLLAMIALLGGVLVFVPVAAAALYLLLFIVMRAPIRTAMRLSATTSSGRQEMMIETFEKIDGLRAGGLTSAWFREYRDRSGRASMAGFRAAWLSSILESLAQSLYILSGLSIVSLGVSQIWMGSMTAGAMVATMIMTWRVLAPMQTLCNALPRFVQLQNAVGQINRLMNIDMEGKDSDVTARIDNLEGHIRFNSVGLRYSKENDPVFTGLNFEANPGEVVTVTGGNGAGKSTVLKLMNALHYPQAGSVSIDNIDIRQLDPRRLRRNIAYVPQTPDIFHGSVADNLRFADPLASDDTLNKALEDVDLLSYVEKLPQGINTMIGSNGEEQLPTGLAYSISLARAYVQNAPVMVLDELPYAFLNSTAGSIFKSKIEAWKGKKTVLMVTHREDYITLSDRVVLLRSGQVPLVGSPEDIIRTIYEQKEVV